MSRIISKSIYGILISTFIIATMFFSGCVEESGQNVNPNTYYVSQDGTRDYTSVQQAIDDAPQGHTIYLSPGHYNKSIIIDKPLSIIGQNADTTIIDGKNSGNVIKIIGSGNVTLSGLTLVNSGDSTDSYDYDAGLNVNCDNNNFENLIIKDNNVGIHSYSSSNNKYESVIIYNNSYYGMYLYGNSDNNEINNCVFYNTSESIGYALRIKNSNYNIITNTYFGWNARGLYLCCSAKNNIVYHNTFENNGDFNARDDVGNQWHKDENIGGNYWGDYDGADEDDDGFGDTPYHLSSANSRQDSYPLMQPKVTYSP